MPERIETRELVEVLTALESSASLHDSSHLRECLRQSASRLTELEKDRERVEYLFANNARTLTDLKGKWFVYWGDSDETDGEWQRERYDTPRQAIDAAMEAK